VLADKSHSICSTCWRVCRRPQDGADSKGKVRGRGSSIAKAYLVDDGLGESLTHGVRFLQGLVGEEAVEVVGEVERGPRGHGFVTGRYGLLWGL
jgi:hypothetical protein